MVKQYHELSFSENDIENEKYKGLIGSGHQWKERGQLQFDFMIAAGLQPEHTFIDIGCGPLRAGEFFIKYLNKEKYIGFDYAQAYINVSHYIIDQNRKLKEKHPIVSLCTEFDLYKYLPSVKADFGLAFSVLNHCNKAEVHSFFKNMGKSFKSGAKIYVMNDNVKWYPKYLINTDLQVTNMYQSLDSFGIDLRQRLGRDAIQMIGCNNNFLIELTKE